MYTNKTHDEKATVKYEKRKPIKIREEWKKWKTVEIGGSDNKMSPRIRTHEVLVSANPDSCWPIGSPSRTLATN
jgi:hypothetical protein